MATRNSARLKAKTKRRNQAHAARSAHKLEKNLAAARSTQTENRAQSTTFSPQTTHSPAGSPPASSCQAQPANCHVEQPEIAASSVKQVAAAALVLGQNVRKTAEALGVDRRTIQRWRKLDPEFQTALFDAKQEVVVTTRQMLLAAAEEAVQIVEGKLEDEQSARLALVLLRNFGALNAETMDELPKQGEVPAIGTNAQHSSEPTALEFGVQSATCGPAANDADQASSLELVSLELDYLDVEREDLSSVQQLAIDALFEGKSLPEAAAAAKTDEPTLRGWLVGEIRFFTVLSQLQFDRICQLKHRLIALMQKAVQIVRKALAARDGRIAMLLVRGMGLMR